MIRVVVHPYSPSAMGICLFPVMKTGTHTFQRCGKMKPLHLSIKVNRAGEVVEGASLVDAAHILGLPLLYETVE